MVTPGEVLGNSTDIKPGKGAYLSRDTNTVYASITGRRSVIPPSSESPDQVQISFRAFLSYDYFTKAAQSA
nr:exosome complex component CSL4 [Tanacetum cinerariifolium]